jgi:hypothetical protein
MSSIYWRFPKLNGGPKQGYTDPGIETFKGEPLIDNLTREICQNSLDAKSPTHEGPVTVKFELREMDKSQYEMFNQFDDCFIKCKDYWAGRQDDKLKAFLNGIDNTLALQKIPVLVISDYGTTGLTGSREEDSVWEALTHAEGISKKTANDSGGSYGVGKSAPFACSSLSMVFYNTYAIDEQKAFKGVVKLATFLDGGEKTQSIGYYQNQSSVEGHPIFGEDEGCSFSNQFVRDVYGTDVIVVGFNEPEIWSEEILKSALKHFFVAICENKLVVQVGDLVIDSDTINHLFGAKNELDRKKMGSFFQMYSAFTAPEKFVFETNIIEENDIKLYVKKDPTYSNVIGYFRSTGMLVGNEKKRNPYQRYSAVVVVQGEQLGNLLRDAEPARHNRWDSNIISSMDKEKRKRTKNAIDRINHWVKHTINNLFELIQQKEVDADVGEYLADDTDSQLSDDLAGQGNDKMKVNQKLKSLDFSPVKKKIKVIDTGGTTIGNEIKDNQAKVNNDRENSVDVDGKSKTPQVESDPGGSVVGIGDVNGPKSFTRPKITGQKVFILDEALGKYCVKLKINQTSNKVYLAFKSVGDDSKSQDLSVVSYDLNGAGVTVINATEIGPLTLPANQMNEINVCFERKEKMLIEMTVNYKG